MLSNGRVLLGGFHNIIRHNLRFLPVQAGAKIVSTIAILNVIPRSPKRDTCKPHILFDGRLIVRAALQFLLPGVLMVTTAPTEPPNRRATPKS